MAVTGLLALLDDVATILEDAAAMSKVAAQKTAGIAGDDLAVNAEGLVGLAPARELPIVLKVATGSFVNKLILIPVALLLPSWLITPLLMLGGAFLCYEGVHKVLQKFFHQDQAAEDAHNKELLAAVRAGPEALAKVEREKVKQAIITDVVLSAEIIAVALGTVREEPLETKAAVLAIVGVGMTVAIYGFVAALVKIDDVGVHLMTRGSDGGTRRRIGKLLVDAMPWLMKAIAVVGTIAMFLVGGGIVLHGVPGLEAALHHAIEGALGTGALATLANTLASLVTGVVLGGVAVLVVSGATRALGAIRGKR